MLLSACGDAAKLPDQAGIGPNPTIPPPNSTLIPTVNIAAAKGWPEGTQPTPASDLAVNAFATGLDHPRWLYVLPNGDVLVAETNGPPRPEDAKGIKGFFFHVAQKWAGAGVPSANRITLLRDADGDGVAETRTVFLKDLNSPFGMALIGHDLYVANTDAILRFPYVDGETQINAPGVKVADLPAGPINHHWTKNIIASRDGSHLYATVGSNSNAAENGLDKEDRRAAILEIDPATGQSRVFASGLRNPNGMAWQPETGVLWTVVNERDELGSDLVPDYLTSVKDGGFYGWPFSYYGQHVDTRVEPQRPDLVAKAIVPDYALGSHTASLGSHSPRGRRCRSHTGTAPSSGSTAPGIASRAAAIRSSSCRSPPGVRRDSRWMSLLVSSTQSARHSAVRSASRSTGAAACSSPTMSAMPSGAWDPRPRRRQWGIDFRAWAGRATYPTVDRADAALASRS